jgi:hypothetical protein
MRAFNGTPLPNFRSIKKVWTATTPPLTPTDGRFLVALLQGRGHSWSFDDSTGSNWQYSSKGLRATPATVGNGSYSASYPVYGSGGLLVGSDDIVQWNTGYDFDWTVMAWVKLGAGGSFAHVIVNSSGQKWIDGVRNDAASTTFFDMSSGNLALDMTGLADGYFDDLMVIDAAIPAIWATDLGMSSVPIAPLPRLRCRGEMLQNNVYYAIGSDVAFTFVSAKVDGTWYSDLMVVTFSLLEHSRL